jgi:hypothetical protein
MIGRKSMLRLLKSVIAVLAVVYFLIDALFLSIIRPLASRLTNLPIFAKVRAWMASLGPYPTLVLLVVPVVILEPIKPIGAYLMTAGHFSDGVFLIIVAEALKITLVERLFHFSHDKLLTIPWFARGYDVVTRELKWLEGLSAWQALMIRRRQIGRQVRRLLLRLNGQGF